MFGFTDDAATLIRSLTGAADLGAAGGLRMSIDPARGSLAMSLAARPDRRDDVVTRSDVRVFLAPAAAARLHAHTLDAQLRPAPAFFLRDR